jgi:hypothetical protein
MSLANIACVLAERQKSGNERGILMIDWDLEAPGLHRFFQENLLKKRNITEKEYDAEPGLIELFCELEQRTDVFLSKLKELDKNRKVLSGGKEVAEKIVKSIDFDKYISPTEIENLYLMKAGRFGSDDKNEYPEKVNKFNWEDLYNKLPHLIRVFADELAERYDFVLIDSRTGVTDISGICTTLLPEKLVVVFTPNTQSIKGALDVVKRATDYRKESVDSRPLIVFPLVSRVEANMPDLRRIWRYGEPAEKIIGFQPEFERVLGEIYREKKVNLNEYFNQIQVQHIPRYAYGEKIAILDERLDDRLSLRIGYKTFTNKLLENYFPWEGRVALPHDEEDTEYQETRSRSETDQERTTKSEEEIVLEEKLDRMKGKLKWSLRLLGIDFTRLFRTALVILSIAITIVALVTSIMYRQRIDEMKTISQKNEELQQRIAELDKLPPLLEEKEFALKDKDDKINQLYEQINATGNEKDKTILDLNQQLKDANANLVSTFKSAQDYQQRWQKYLDRAIYAEKKLTELNVVKDDLQKQLAACKNP